MDQPRTRTRVVLRVGLQLAILVAFYFLVSYERRHQEVLTDIHDDWMGAHPPPARCGEPRRRDHLVQVIDALSPELERACDHVRFGGGDPRHCVDVAFEASDAMMRSSAGEVHLHRARQFVDQVVDYVQGSVHSLSPQEVITLQSKWHELVLRAPPLGPPLAAAIAQRGCDWRTWTFLAGDWSSASGTSIWKRRHFALHAREWIDCDSDLGACLRRLEDESPRGAPRCSGNGTDYFGLCRGPLSVESQIYTGMFHGIDLRARLRLLAVWLAAVARGTNDMSTVPEWSDPRLVDPYTGEPFLRDVRGQHVELTAQLTWGRRSLPLPRTQN